MLAAAILAAGESRRMGRPKALLPFRGTTFAEHLYAAMDHPRVGVRRIVLGAGADLIEPRLRAGAGAIMVNERWPEGQLSSIQAAIRSLPPDATEGLILCPVDHALVTAGLVADLIAQFDATEKLIVVPVYRGRRGHPAIFRASLYGELLSAPAEIGARHVLHSRPRDVLEMPTGEEGAVLNLNDQKTLEAALHGAI
ncbi:MAG TPA: nucleotidyltransferase family protein [Candidatus Acidoferrales bacterium]|nr:nucleotidyltransferase family protein [Candidatus Acidoferrales bacterium]